MSTSGPNTIMTYEEEKAFSDWIITCSNLNIPTPKSICDQKASMILERRDSKFKTKTGLPSKEWWYGFYKRWPAVAPRKPQPLSRGKALLTKEHVTLMGCYSTTGVYIPPFFIFQGQRIGQGLMDGAPIGSVVG